MIIQIILTSLFSFVIGYSVANILRLKKVRKCLKDLQVGEPQFEGKIEIIKKFNTIF